MTAMSRRAPAPVGHPSPERDSGFTLVELLVVIIVIGILAAIAIPVYLKQRQKAVEASLKSDLKNMATYIESQINPADPTYANSDRPYFTGSVFSGNLSETELTMTFSPTGIRASPGNVLYAMEITRPNATPAQGNMLGGFCAIAVNPNDATDFDGSAMSILGPVLQHPQSNQYDSLSGGLTRGPSTKCAALWDHMY